MSRKKKTETAMETAEAPAATEALAAAEAPATAERPSDSTYSADLRVGAEIVHMVETRRRPRYRPWLIEIVPDETSLDPRPLSAEELRCAGPWAVGGIIAICKEELMRLARRGIYGGYLQLPPRRELVARLSSSGTRVRMALDWLESMNALQPYDGGGNKFRLSPYVAYAGKMTLLKVVPDYAAGLWTPAPDAWRQFWEQAAGRPLLADRAAEFLHRLDEQQKALKEIAEGVEKVDMPS